MENENKDWKPEVGKTVWYLSGLVCQEVKVLGIYWHKANLGNPDLFVLNADISELFPTPEAALASIKIYDLEGKEVVIPRAIHFSGICSECGSSIALDAKQTNAMNKLAEAAYNMQLGGGAAIGGKSDQREGGC